MYIRSLNFFASKNLIRVEPCKHAIICCTGPVLVRCCQYRPSTGPVLAHNGMFMGNRPETKDCDTVAYYGANI